MTKKELIKKVITESNATEKDTIAIVDEMFECIKATIKEGEKVTIVGFGNFEPKYNKARIGINPATGEKIQIKSSNSVKFKVGKTFKDDLK